MPQIHYSQQGLFHVVTKTWDSRSWCTNDGVPARLIEKLFLARDLHQAHLFAFCVLPNHLHMILSPGPKGLSKFMQTFKSHSTKEVRERFGMKNAQWQEGFYDELILTLKQRMAAMSYVQCNASKHHLVPSAAKWPWTSLHFQEKIDQFEIL